MKSELTFETQVSEGNSPTARAHPPRNFDAALGLAPYSADGSSDESKQLSNQRTKGNNKIPQKIKRAGSTASLDSTMSQLGGNLVSLRLALRCELEEMLAESGKIREVMREELRGALGRDGLEPLSPGLTTKSSLPQVSPRSKRALRTSSESEGETSVPKRRSSMRSVRSDAAATMSENSSVVDEEEAKEYFSQIVNTMARNADEKDESVQGTRSTWAAYLEEKREWCSSIQEPERRGLLPRITQSKQFEGFILSVIFINCSFMAYSADQEVANPGVPDPTTILGDWVFQIIYTMELVMKLGVHRHYFFINDSWKANWFDAFLVVTGWLGMVDTGSGGGGFSGSFLRVVRLAKLGRTMRAVRAMSELKHLRAFLICLQGSFMSFFWSLVMLVAVLTIFSLFMVQILGGYLVENDLTIEGDMKELYGTVSTSILTLFRMSTGGNDWSEGFVVIAKTGWTGAVIYLIFIAFTQLALINIITGIFVESAMQTLRPDREMITMEQLRLEKDNAREVEDICSSADNDGNGKMSKQEFGLLLSKGRLPKLLLLLGLSKHHVVEFFDTMSALCDDGEVEIATFVQGCMQLKGAATNFDVQMIHAELRSHFSKQQKFLIELSEQMNSLEEQVADGYDHKFGS